MGNLREFARVLRHGDFRWLWLSQSASVIGDMMVGVAISLFVIDRTGSARDLGYVLAASAVPLITLLLVGGVWADRLARQRVVMATDLACCVLHGLLAVLIFTGEVTIWQLVVIEALFGAVEAFFRPAVSGLLPQTVPESDIQQAGAVLAMSRNVATVAGPSLATLLILTAGAGWAFAFDSATFIVSAACLTQVRPRERAPLGDAASKPSIRAEIRDGFHEVRTRVWVWATLLAFTIADLAALAPLLVLGSLVAREQYGHTAVYGAVIAAFGAGTITGSLAGIRWRPHYPMRFALIVILLWPLATVLYGAGVAIYVALPGFALAGIGSALFDVWWLTALAERIPPGKLSRVTSYDWLVSSGLLPVGYIIVGPLASALGSVAVMTGGGVIAGTALAAALLPRGTRMLERLPSAVDQTGVA
jgi:predicted MFS family arabinose efflux permease